MCIRMTCGFYLALVLVFWNRKIISYCKQVVSKSTNKADKVIKKLILVSLKKICVLHMTWFLALRNGIVFHLIPSFKSFLLNF